MFLFAYLKINKLNYLSPFHILPDGIEIENLSNKKILKRARKLVLAEFELQNTTTIIINNQTFDKDAVLKYFEALEKDLNLNFHAIIFNNKALLSFLETTNIKRYEEAIAVIKPQEYQSNNDAFISFIAPYFTHNFNELFSKAIKQNDKLILDVLLKEDFPLPQKYEVDAYRSAYRWYHSKLRNAEEIEGLLNQKKFVNSESIHELIDLTFIETFNQLPTYFYNVRDEYAFQLYEIVFVLNNELKRVSLARSIVDAGLQFDVEYSTMQYFEAASKVIESDNKKGGKYNWISLYVIFQAILIIFRVATCNDSSSSNNYNFDNSDFKYVLPKPFEDSVFKENNVRMLDKQFKGNRRKLDSLIKVFNSNIKLE